MTSVAALEAARALCAQPSSVVSALDIALLGCGNVGAAFAAMAQEPQRDCGIRITHALVRDRLRQRPTLHPDAVRIDDVAAVFETPVDMVVELLGGLEPARTLVVEALQRGIPVVTANKSLLAAHGAELREAASRHSTPLRYEAAVIAGVPFLGAFARRPHAAEISGLLAIANGTSNYILTQARRARCGVDLPLAEAQRLGYAEPDPSKDVDGIDAAEKLVVLLQHFAGLDVPTRAIETTGIRELDATDLEHAQRLDGVVKPVVSADWSSGLQAFVGPAFLGERHVLAGVDGVENGLVLAGSRGRLVFRGPGAGPEVTAATVMDDVLEAREFGPTTFAPLERGEPGAPDTGWFVTITSKRLPGGIEIADLLASHGVYLQRTTLSTRDDESLGALTWPAPRRRIEAAFRALAAATGAVIRQFRRLDD